MSDNWYELSQDDLRDEVNARLETLSDDLKGMEQAYHHFVATLDRSLGQPLFAEVKGNIDFQYAEYQYAVVQKSIARATAALHHIEILRQLQGFMMAPVRQLDRDIDETVGTALLLEKQASAYFRMMPVENEYGDEEAFETGPIRGSLTLIQNYLAEFLMAARGHEKDATPSKGASALHDDLHKNLLVYGLFTLDAVDNHLHIAKALFNVLSVDPNHVPALVKEGYPNPDLFLAETMLVARNQLMAVPAFIDRVAKAIENERHLRGAQKLQNVEVVSTERSRSLPLFQLDHLSL